MLAGKLAILSPEPIPSPDKTTEWCHINRMEVRVRLLELVRGRAIDHPASELGQTEELLRGWREAFRLVEQGHLRIGVAFEEVNRLLVVPDVALKRSNALLDLSAMLLDRSAIESGGPLTEPRTSHFQRPG